MAKNTNKLNKSELFGSIVSNVFGLITKIEHKLTINTKHKFLESDFSVYVNMKRDYEMGVHVERCWERDVSCNACEYAKIPRYSTDLFNLFINYSESSEGKLKNMINETISHILFGDNFKNTNKPEKQVIADSIEMILNLGRKYKIL